MQEPASKYILYLVLYEATYSERLGFRARLAKNLSKKLSQNSKHQCRMVNEHANLLKGSGTGSLFRWLEILYLYASDFFTNACIQLLYCSTLVVQRSFK